MLREKTVAIVGNGPSGNNRGDVIDSMDFVVRVNMWRRTGPVNSGEKISAIAGYRRRTVDLPTNDRQQWEFWCNIPEEAAGEGSLLELDWVRKVSSGRILRFIRGTTCGELNDYLRSISTSPKKRIVTTAGLASIAMAIEYSPKELHLWGYDRTDDIPGKSANSWARMRLSPIMAARNTVHDFKAEKHVISKLVDKGIWCERPIGFKTFWHGRPQVCPIIP